MNMQNLNEKDKIDFRTYNKLSYDQEKKAFYVISLIQDHYIKSLIPIFSKKYIKPLSMDVTTLPFSSLKEGLSESGYTKEYSLDNDQLFLSITKKSVNALMNRDSDTPLDKISMYTFNKFFFELYPSHINYEYSGDVSSEEDAKEVLSEKLGQDEEVKSEKEETTLKCKTGDATLFYALTFEYDCDTYPLYITVSLSYLTALKLINEEKTPAFLHSKDYYKKDNFFAVLCSGKLTGNQLKEIKEGSILKFKTPIDSPIKLYRCEKPVSSSFALVKGDFYSLQEVDEEIIEENTENNTHLCLSIMKNIVKREGFIETDTKVSASLPLIVDNKIIALAYPLSNEERFCAKIDKLLNPPLNIE